MTTTEEIRKALIEALKQPMITQRELAEKIGVSQSMISHYASGRKMPSLDTLSRLCSVLDLDANEILCIKEIIYIKRRASKGLLCVFSHTLIVCYSHSLKNL